MRTSPSDSSVSGKHRPPKFSDDSRVDVFGGCVPSHHDHSDRRTACIERAHSFSLSDLSQTPFSPSSLTTASNRSADPPSCHLAN